MEFAPVVVRPPFVWIGSLRSYEWQGLARYLIYILAAPLITAAVDHKLVCLHTLLETASQQRYTHQETASPSALYSTVKASC